MYIHMKVIQCFQLVSFLIRDHRTKAGGNTAVADTKSSTLLTEGTANIPMPMSKLQEKEVLT